jgi:aminomethyltransferase
MADDTTEKHVPLEDRHRELGARMTDFGGFQMPVQFEGIKAEHRAVRENVGLFDVSHMGEVVIEGPDAIEVIDALVTNDATKLDDGQAQYTAMCSEQGGIVDDLVYYRLGPERVLAVVNAANRDKDFAHMTDKAHEYCAEADAALTDEGDDWVQLALQGPNAEAMLQNLTSYDLEDISFYRSAFAEVAGIEMLVSRTGYTGEDGFELYCDAGDGDALFDALLDEGEDWDMQLCGLGARDTLRLEAMFNLYGQDMDESTTPYACRMGWTVKLDKDADFVGEEALRQQKESGGPERTLRGFILEGRGVIRPGYAILVDGEEVGEITSGTFAPTLEESIGLGYIDSDLKDVDQVDIAIRNRTVSARATDKPFYSR